MKEKKSARVEQCFYPLLKICKQTPTNGNSHAQFSSPSSQLIQPNAPTFYPNNRKDSHDFVL